MNQERRKLHPRWLVVAGVLGVVAGIILVPMLRSRQDTVLIVAVKISTLTSHRHCNGVEGNACLDVIEQWINSQGNVNKESIATWAGAVLDLAEISEGAAGALSDCSSNVEHRHESRITLRRALAVGDKLAALPVDSTDPAINAQFAATWASIRAEYERVMSARCPGEASV